VTPPHRPPPPADTVDGPRWTLNRQPAADTTNTQPHMPLRPSWLCSGCGLDWPCPARRAQLLAEHHQAHVSLGLYLGACLVQAARDLPDAPAGVLYERFIAWFRTGRH
jgi:hypothetical protein